MPTIPFNLEQKKEDMSLTECRKQNTDDYE